MKASQINCFAIKGDFYLTKRAHTRVSRNFRGPQKPLRKESSLIRVNFIPTRIPFEAEPLRDLRKSLNTWYECLCCFCEDFFSSFNLRQQTKCYFFLLFLSGPESPKKIYEENRRRRNSILQQQKRTLHSTKGQSKISGLISR